MRYYSPEPKAVVWDFDGTMIEGSELVYDKATASTLVQFGLTQFEDGFSEEVVSELAGGASKDVWTYFRDHHGLEASLEEFNLVYLQRLEIEAQNAVALGTLRMRPHVTQCMEEVKARGMRQLIATNGLRDEVDVFMKILGLTRSKLAEIGIEKEKIVYVSGVKRAKPYPDIYLLAARRLGLHPWECAAVEDTRRGALAAAYAGMRVIARAEQDVSVFRGLRDEVRHNPEFWASVIREFRGQRGWFKQLHFRDQVFIISPESSPLGVIDKVRSGRIDRLGRTPAGYHEYESLLLEKDLSRPRQATLTKAVLKGAVQAPRNQINGRHRRSGKLAA
jgi:beta-phosphoglucomutase-like phosphatase (HAD superfamily)